VVLRTQDGRIIDYSGSQDDETAPSSEYGVEALQPFMDACQAALSARRLSRNERIALFLFFLGAADRMWRRYDIDDRRFAGFAARLLQALGVSASAAAALSFSLPQLREVETASEIINAGANLFELWLDGHDSNALLQLPELVRQWGDYDLGLNGRD
jgi:hypothetical protein